MFVWGKSGNDELRRCKWHGRGPKLVSAFLVCGASDDGAEMMGVGGNVAYDNKVAGVAVVAGVAGVVVSLAVISAKTLKVTDSRNNP